MATHHWVPTVRNVFLRRNSTYYFHTSREVLWGWKLAAIHTTQNLISNVGTHHAARRKTNKSRYLLSVICYLDEIFVRPRLPAFYSSIWRHGVFRAISRKILVQSAFHPRGDSALLVVVVVVVVVVFTLKAVPVSTQYFSNIRTGPTDADAFRGHRLTTQKGYTYQKEIKGPRKVNTHAIIGK